MRKIDIGFGIVVSLLICASVFNIVRDAQYRRAEQLRRADWFAGYNYTNAAFRALGVHVRKHLIEHGDGWGLNTNGVFYGFPSFQPHGLSPLKEEAINAPEPIGADKQEAVTNYWLYALEHCGVGVAEKAKPEKVRVEKHKIKADVKKEKAKPEKVRVEKHKIKADVKKEKVTETRVFPLMFDITEKAQKHRDKRLAKEAEKAAKEAEKEAEKAAEARAEKEALLTEIKALGNKQKITPADVKAVAEKHDKQRGKPAPKKEKKQ